MDGLSVTNCFVLVVALGTNLEGVCFTISSIAY